MTSIHLTGAEILMGSQVGSVRQAKSVMNGRRDNHGYSGSGWSEHIEGALGELVVAKALGIYWDGGIDTFKGDDLPGIQVRTRSRDDWDLIVRSDDDDSARFILVVGKCPNYRVVGWILGRDAKRPEWLKTHGGREPAYFVPQSSLREIGEL